MTTRAPQHPDLGETMVPSGEPSEKTWSSASPTPSRPWAGHPFGIRFPDRLLDFGIAEQDCVMAAAGMAPRGKIPFVGSYAMFLSMRTLEQIRTFISYPSLNVKIWPGWGLTPPGFWGSPTRPRRT